MVVTAAAAKKPKHPQHQHQHQHQRHQRHVVNALEELGVHLLEAPNATIRDETFADALGDFASFCLHDEANTITIPILDRYLDEDHPCVGELQGGTDHSSIYRVSITDDDDDDDDATTTAVTDRHDDTAVAELFQAFRLHYPKYTSIWTVGRLQQYLLAMCNDPRRRRRHNNYSDDAVDDDNDGNGDDFCSSSAARRNRRRGRRNYTQLGNLMFIMSFGPVPGQVRHIDHMDPNLQVCLYMSDHCPATVVYELQEPIQSPSITNVPELVAYWRQPPQNEEKAEEPQQPQPQIATDTDTDTDPIGKVPELVQVLLTELGDVALAGRPTLQYFSFWRTINKHLQQFGKLYQAVHQRWAIEACSPGTTLIAHGNQVHAGPPSNIPRMFAFCIGIPDDDDDHDDHDEDEDDDHDNNNIDTADNPSASDDHDRKEDQATNDGEIQYNPVLLHIDLCCILFTSLEFCCEEDDDQDYYTNRGYNATTILETKRFLLNMLPTMIQEYPHETYARLLGDDRELLRTWLGELVQAVASSSSAAVFSSLSSLSSSSSSISRCIESAIQPGAKMLLSPDIAEGTALRRKRDKALKKERKKQKSKAKKKSIGLEKQAQTEKKK